MLLKNERSGTANLSHGCPAKGTFPEAGVSELRDKLHLVRRQPMVRFSGAWQILPSTTIFVETMKSFKLFDDNMFCCDITMLNNGMNVALSTNVGEIQKAALTLEVWKKTATKSHE